MSEGAIEAEWVYFAFSQPEEKTRELPLHPDLCCDTRSSSLCEGNLFIPRNEMPQFANATYIQQFFDFLSSRHNITTNEKTTPATNFMATQCNLVSKKILDMVESFYQNKFNPCESGGAVIASSDQYIVDGHHRWAACHMLNGNLTVTRLGARIRNILQYAKSFGAPQAISAATEDCCIYTL